MEEMKKKLRILLSAKGKWENYVDAVTACGAEADARYLPEYSEDYDGLILCGGSDIHPRYYGQEINGAFGCDESRDAAEFALADAFIKAGKPVLGICRGAQLLNIYFGGSLHQHIGHYMQHRSDEGDAVHDAIAAEGSVLYDLYGGHFRINSKHHQALNRIGEGLRVTMVAEDEFQTVEAIEHESLPVIAVQWHPERMTCSRRREDTVDGMPVFRHFLKMCGN